MKHILFIFMILHTVFAQAGAKDAAREQYIALVSKKMISSNIIFLDGKDHNYSHTPGYATFDFEAQICTIFLNENAIKEFKFDEPFSFRFMVYHEISHCELYAKPHTILLPQVNTEFQQMASDIIHLEFFHSSMGRVNAYNTYHEIFADIMAISMMKQADNENNDALEKIMTYRAKNIMSFVDNHDSFNAIKKYLINLDSKTPYESAKSYAEGAMEEAFFIKVFKKNLTEINIKELLDGTIRTAKSQDSKWSNLEERTFIKQRVNVMLNSNNRPWKSYANAHKNSSNAEQALSLFYADRY